jgi:hypothetical protein
MINMVYLASLRTEEARFVRGSLCFANPCQPDLDPPIVRRADYPGYTAFGKLIPLNVESLVKLSRAVDKWSGSIAVYCTPKADLYAWGIVDQMIHVNVRMNREGTHGFANPGIFNIEMDGVGALSVYSDRLFFGALRQDQLITREHDALNSEMVWNRIAPFLLPVAHKIAKVAGDPDKKPDKILKVLFSGWTEIIARLCIGLRRVNSGGAFLISPTPVSDLLDVTHSLSYRRLGDSALLSVLDNTHYHANRHELIHSGSDIPRELCYRCSSSDVDREDRERELTGAARIVTSLAAVDGLVMLDPFLNVIAFGVKIKSDTKIGRVYDGADFVRRGIQGKRIEPSLFGTRHASMLRYCLADQDALGVVVSQDGYVRIIMREGKHLILWDNVKLLSYSRGVRAYARELRRGKKYRAKTLTRRKPSLGYSSMPKTVSELMRGN